MVFLGMHVRLDLKVTIVVFFDICFFLFYTLFERVIRFFPRLHKKESAKCRNIDAAFSRNVPMTQQE